MTNQQVAVSITVLTVTVQAGLYLITGGFNLGNRVADITSEIKLLRAEVVAQNEIQNYRLDKLELLKTAKSSN